MSNFRPIGPGVDVLMRPSEKEWLLQRLPTRLVVEEVDSLDLCAMSGSYLGSGSASYCPAVLLSLLIYGRAIGILSRRKLERHHRGRIDQPGS